MYKRINYYYYHKVIYMYILMPHEVCISYIIILIQRENLTNIHVCNEMVWFRKFPPSLQLVNERTKKWFTKLQPLTSPSTNHRNYRRALASVHRRDPCIPYFGKSNCLSCDPPRLYKYTCTCSCTLYPPLPVLVEANTYKPCTYLKGTMA